MSLEEKVADKESSGFIKKAITLGWKLGMAAATTAIGTATLPSLGALSTLGIAVGGAFAAGGAIANLVSGKSIYESISTALTTYSAVNAVIYPMVWLGDQTFNLIPNATLAGKIARGIYASTVYNAAFVGSYNAAEHLVDNYLNPTGLGKAVADGFPNKWAQVGLLFSPFYSMAANNIGSIAFNNFYVPTFASNRIIPQYVNQLTAPTFAAGSLPVGFMMDYFFPKKSKNIEKHL